MDMSFSAWYSMIARNLDDIFKSYTRLTHNFNRQYIPIFIHKRLMQQHALSVHNAVHK
jgi:hypothetical protein